MHVKKSNNNKKNVYKISGVSFNFTLFLLAKSHEYSKVVEFGSVRNSTVTKELSITIICYYKLQMNWHFKIRWKNVSESSFASSGSHPINQNSLIFEIIFNMEISSQFCMQRSVKFPWILSKNSSKIVTYESNTKKCLFSKQNWTKMWVSEKLYHY